MTLIDRLLEILATDPGLTIAQLSKRTGYSPQTIATVLRRSWVKDQVMRRSAFEEETPGLRWYVFHRSVSPGSPHTEDRRP